MFNPKSYMYGSNLIEMSKVADNMAEEYGVDVFVIAPYSDISEIAKVTKNVIVTSQHLDASPLGRGMGIAVTESLYEAGVRATVLNHAEHPLTISELKNSIDRAKELSLFTIVCANSIVEARAIAIFSPDIILCEPNELIGTGKISDDNYVNKTNNAIKEINKEILVMQGAGIKTPKDVEKLISLGADGIGCTSGITTAENPKETLTKMIKVTSETKQVDPKMVNN